MPRPQSATAAPASADAAPELGELVRSLVDDLKSLLGLQVLEVSTELKDFIKARRLVGFMGVLSGVFAFLSLGFLLTALCLGLITYLEQPAWVIVLGVGLLCAALAAGLTMAIKVISKRPKRLPEAIPSRPVFLRELWRRYEHT